MCWVRHLLWRKGEHEPAPQRPLHAAEIVALRVRKHPKLHLLRHAARRRPLPAACPRPLLHTPAGAVWRCRWLLPGCLHVGLQCVGHHARLRLARRRRRREELDPPQAVGAGNSGLPLAPRPRHRHRNLGLCHRHPRLRTHLHRRRSADAGTGVWRVHACKHASAGGAHLACAPAQR